MTAATMGNLLWGLQISAIGMGLVFGLLVLLWGLLTIVLRWDPPAATATAAPAPAPKAERPALDPELVAAIVVATLAHRAVRRNEAAPVMRSYWPGSLLHASRWLGAGRSRQNHSWQRRHK